MQNKIIFATSNEGKMKERRMILADLPLEVLSLKEAEIQSNVEENGADFLENAFIKAKAIAEKVNCIVIADDSGLEIDYLNKEPGIYSARYLGENTSYQIKNKTLIDRLEGVPLEKRTARFVCAIATILPNGEQYSSYGTIEGYIGYQERGNNGFGYDPIFMVPELNCSTAELSSEQKNKYSHRGKALKEMKHILREKVLNENEGASN